MSLRVRVLSGRGIVGRFCILCLSMFLRRIMAFLSRIVDAAVRIASSSESTSLSES